MAFGIVDRKGQMQAQTMSNVGAAGQSMGEVLKSKVARWGMSDFEKAYSDADKEDRTKIEALIELMPQLAEPYRQKEIDRVRKAVLPISQPYLNLMLQRGGEAPPLGIETWRMGGKPAPEAAKTAVAEGIAGQTTGFEHQLRLGALEPGARLAEWGRRAPTIAAKYPRAGEIGRTMIDVTSPAAMTETERVQARARQDVSPGGGWAGLQEITGKWTPATSKYHQEKMIDDAFKANEINQRTVDALKTFVRTDNPEWMRPDSVPTERLADLGLAEGPDGKRFIQYSENKMEKNQQQRMQEIWMTEQPTLEGAHKMARANDAIMLAVLGKENLNAKQINQLNTKESEFKQWEVFLIERPAIDAGWKGDWIEITKYLRLFFTPAEVQAIVVLATDKMVEEGRLQVNVPALTLK